jgi:hypothetical protein
VWPAEQLHNYDADTFHKNYGFTIMTSIAERTYKPANAVQPFSWWNHAIDERYELIAAKVKEAEWRIGNVNSQMANRAELLTQTEERIRDANLQMAARAGLLAKAEDRITQLTLELTALRSSNSWRVTAPIRSTIKKFRFIYRLANKSFGNERPASRLRRLFRSCFGC